MNLLVICRYYCRLHLNTSFTQKMHTEVVPVVVSYLCLVVEIKSAYNRNGYVTVVDVTPILLSYIDLSPYNIIHTTCCTYAEERSLQHEANKYFSHRGSSCCWFDLADSHWNCMHMLQEWMWIFPSGITIYHLYYMQKLTRSAKSAKQQMSHTPVVLVLCCCILFGQQQEWISQPTGGVDLPVRQNSNNVARPFTSINECAR